MTKRFFALSILFLVCGSQALAIRALDDNYLAPSGPQTSNTNAVEVLNPNFFDDTRGTLEKAPEGKFACTTVWSRSARGESAGIGKVAQNFCGSAAPQIKWIPRLQSWTGVPGSYNNNDAVAGYYQVCCVKSSGKRLGRYRAP